MNRQKEKYYNYVVDDLVKKTEIDHEKKELYPPFNILSSTELYIVISSSLYSYCLLQIFSSFAKHCESVYGLNEQEIEYVWDEYVDIMKGKLEPKGNINESTDIKFLDRVVYQIVSETIIDNGEIRIPNISSLNLSKVELYYPYVLLHLKNVYGIRDNEEITYIWWKYSDIIKDKLKPKEYVYESTGFNKTQQKYYQYIVKDLIAKTIITANDYDDLSYSHRYQVKFPWERLNIGEDNITLDFVMGEVGGFFDYTESHYGTTTDDSLSIMVMFGMELEKQYSN